MFSKTNLISTLVGTIWVYLGGYLLWVVIGPSLGLSEADSVDQVHLIIACLISAFAFSTIYSKLGGGHTTSNGAQFGLWAGIFIGLGERWFDVAMSADPNLQTVPLDVD